MIKKISVEKLRPGMFVDDFDCSWFKHPFLRSKIKITNQKMVDKIVQYGIREVYIDTSKGLDVYSSSYGKGLLKEIEAQLALVQEAKKDFAKFSSTLDASPVNSGSKTASDPKSDGTRPSRDEREAPGEARAEHSGGPETTSAPSSRPAPAGDAPLPSPEERGAVPDHGEPPPRPRGPEGEPPSAPGPSQVEQAETGEHPAEETSPGDDQPEAGQAGPEPEAPAPSAEVVPHEAGQAAPRVEEGPEPPVSVSASEREAGPDEAQGASGAPQGDKEDRKATHPRLTGELEERPPLPKNTPLNDEIFDATRIKTEAKQVIQKALEDARLGKQIQMEKVYPMVGKIVDSILRNPDALLTLSALKKADDYTYMHSLSVCVLMVCFARSLELPKDVITQFGVGGLLHDVGKVKVPPEILHKAGRLSESEEEKLREHVEHGMAILSRTRGVTPIAMQIAVEHHERYDGIGYPRGLKGDEISPHGQAAAIANMYDILTSDRWYRKGMEPTEALSKLLGWGRIRFDDEMIQKFIRCVGIYPIGTLVRMKSGLLGVVVEQGPKDLLHPIVRVIYDTRKEWFIKPRDLDLSIPVTNGPSDKIVCHESPEKWKIKPQTYLSNMVRESGPLSRRLQRSTVH